LQRVRALAEQFVHNDPLRSGTIDEITFRSIVVVAGDAILGFEFGRDAHRLVDLCIRRFKNESPDSDVCYLDFWACLLAYLHEFQGGVAGLTGAEALNAMTVTMRGLDIKQASALSQLIQYMQCPQREGYTWTTGLKKAESEDSNLKVISRRGHWKIDVSIQQDLPGTLSAHEIRPSADVSIVPPRIEIKEQLNAVLSSILPETQRGLTTLSGEIFKPSKTITRLEDKVPLHLADLSVGAFLETSGREVDIASSPLGKSMVQPSHSLSSSARRMSKMSVASEQSHMDHDLGLYASLDQSEISEAANMDGDARLAEQNNESFDIHGYDSMSPQNNKLIALDGMEKRRLQLLTEEQALLQKQQQELEEYSRRRASRNMHQKKLRVEHRSKEKNWLEFKEKEDSARSDRKQRGIVLYEKALKAQRDDERRAANVAMERLLEEKMRERRIKAEREAKEREEKERVRELDERHLMKKEEHLSMEIEAAIAERLRLEKEKAEKAAAEAERKAAAERERIRVEEDARRLQEEKERALADAAIALKEGLLMAQQDYNILLIPEPEPEPEPEPVPAEEPEPEPEPEQALIEAPVPEEEDKLGDSDTPWLTMRMTALVGKLKAANQRHLSHPRWSVEGGYFMPQLFSQDISFQPFDSSAANQTEVLETWSASDIGKSKIKKIDAAAVSADGSAKSGSFEDITSSVKAHKMLLMRQRLEQLYQTSSSEASPADWTEVFRVAVVDWGAFFHEQQDILYERPTTPPPTIDEEAEFLAQMKQVAVNQPESTQLAQNLEIPESFLAAFNQSSPEPLPFAKVARGIVHPKCYKYYQAEIVDSKSFVTIELKVDKGFAELLLMEGKGELPTLTSHQRRVQAEHFNKRVARMNFTPERAQSIFVGVYSDEGAQFQLWIFATSNPDVTSGPIQHVSKSLREFDLLSNQPLESLHIKLPSLVEQAKRIVEFENKMAKPSILGDLQQAIDSGTFTSSALGAAAGRAVDKDENEDIDEIEIMDRFISKAGRRLMRKDLRDLEAAAEMQQIPASPKSQNPLAGLRATVEDEEDSAAELNPNDHVELFPPPRLQSRQSFLELVNQQRKMQDRESLRFTMLSLAQRGGASPSLSKSLDFQQRSKALKVPSSAKLPTIKYTLSGNQKL